MRRSIHTPAPAAILKWPVQPGRRLPPFGKPLADAFLKGLQPKGRQAMVYLDSWPPEKPPFGPALACPWDSAPEDYDWRILAGLDVLVKAPTSCDDERLRRLLAELIPCKPRRLIVVRSEAPHLLFVVSATRGVEVRL
ncbi:MAG: hypothetical protein JSS57_02495 [Proteobacteria bacterium]|nr:hypothetical protein [Pseudomonadota bacterium]